MLRDPRHVHGRTSSLGEERVVLEMAKQIRDYLRPATSSSRASSAANGTTTRCCIFRWRGSSIATCTQSANQARARDFTSRERLSTASGRQRATPAGSKVINAYFSAADRYGNTILPVPERSRSANHGPDKTGVAPELLNVRRQQFRRADPDHRPAPRASCSAVGGATGLTCRYRTAFFRHRVARHVGGKTK